MKSSEEKQSIIASQFLEIIKNKDEKAIIPFLKSLQPEEREIIRKEAIKIHDKNKIYRTNSYMQEVDIFTYVHFFCFRKEDSKYIRIKWRDFPKPEEMEELLSESIPEGFPDLYGVFLMNEYIRKDIYGKSAMSYEDIMRWLRKGYVCPIEPYIAMRMDEIFPRYPEDEIIDTEKYIQARLAQYPEILNEQIYYLFKYDNEVSYADKLGKIKVGKTGAWTYILKTYTQNGQLERMYFLRECLNATNQNFKKDQLNWYIGLFEGMEPTDNELIELQDDLFVCLSGILTKQVTVCLHMIKRIVTDNNFRTEDFLLLTPTLLTSETKAIVVSTLAILEKIATKDKNIHELICIHATNAFINKEENIQTRAAKLISKYGNPTSETLKERLIALVDSMLMSTQSLLSDYLSGGKKTEIIQQTSPDKTYTFKHINDENKINLISTPEELIFQLGRALNNFESADFYLIPDALFRLRKEITEEVLVQAGPLIQKAYKIVTNFNPGRSFHLSLLAFFFLKYCQYQFTVLPEGNKDLKKLRDTYEPLFQYVDRWFGEPEATGDSYTAWEGFKRLTLYYLEKFKTNSKLPILCTPTNHPTWLDPVLFISRLKEYQHAGIEPDTMDMQQALHLCVSEDKENMLAIINQELSGEYRELLCWLFDINHPLPLSIEHKEWWLTAAIANPELEIPQEWLTKFDPILIPYLQNKFDWYPYIDTVTAYIQKNPETGEDEPFIRHDSRLQFNIERLYTPVVKDLNLFAAFMYTGYPWAADLMSNIKGIMLATPNNWQTILAKIAWENIQFASDTIGKYMISILEVYKQTLVKAYDMDILYITLCMLQKDKTLRTYVGDLWVEMTELDLIDNAILGQTIGKFEAIEYAPLKRFTEIIQNNMIGRSSHHNKELEILVNECITQIGDKPVANIKKLTSIQKELKALNKF